MSVVSEVAALATRVATEVKAIRTLVNGNAANLNALTTTAKGNLVLAINEVKAGATGGGGQPVIIVAAANAPQSAKDAATASGGAICDGVDDHVEINAALTAAKAVSTSNHGRGIVLLSAGDFSIGQIELQNFTGLRGCGRNATYLKVKNSLNANAIIAHVSTNTATDPNAGYTYLGHFTLDGNKANQTSGGGVYVTRNPVTGSNAADLALRTLNNDWDQHHIFEDLMITNCKGTGFETTGMSSSLAKNVHCYGNDGYGIVCGFDTEYIGCVTGNTGLSGFRVNAPSVRIVGCKSFYSGNLSATDAHGFYVGGNGNGTAYGVQIVGSEAQDNIGYGLFLEGYCRDNKFDMICESNQRLTASGGAAIGFAAGSNTQEFCQFNIVTAEGKNMGGTVGQKHALHLVASAKNNDFNIRHSGVWRDANADVLSGLTAASVVDATNRVNINGSLWDAAGAGTATKTTDLASLAGSAWSVADILGFIDVSDTAMSAQGSDVKGTFADLITFLRTNGPIRTYKQSAQLSNATTTMANVPGIAFPVVSGERYAFTYRGKYRSSLATAGIGFVWTGPAITDCVWQLETNKTKATNGGTSATAWWGDSVAMTTELVSDATTTTATDLFIEIKGIVQPSASGTFQLQMRAEVAATLLLNANGTLVVEALG